MPLSSTFKLFLGPLLFLTLLLGGTASADNVESLIERLSTNSDYKVRISAALSLSKLRDQRAVWPFVKALKDADKTVRGVAAAALGKTVNSTTSAKMRARVLQELKKTATSDSNSFVRKQAQKAFDVLGNIGGPTTVSAGGIYVNIGLMSAKTEDATKIRKHMRKTVLKTFKKKASSMIIDWPGGKDPSKKQISQNKVKAFHVDGTINELTAAPLGSSTTVSCKVSMLIASYPEKSMFGFLKGGAQVRSSSSAKEVQYAKEDCVAAVMEDLVARKIIPTIKSRP
ncbi:MAG: HEAT repeat domain-containing protein [Myxococcales bacterium]|nr:HEAT repeat domain-containing protein [Myxococcales bacterium]